MTYANWTPVAWGEVRGSALWADWRITDEPTPPPTTGDRAAVSTDCRYTAAMETNASLWQRRRHRSSFCSRLQYKKKNTKIVRLSVIDIIQQSEAENDAECKRRKRTMNRCVKWLRSLNENYYNHRFNPLADTACQTVCYLCLVILCAKTIYPLQRSLVHGLSPDIAQNFPDVIHHPRCWYKLVVSLYSRIRNYWISFSTRCQICYCNQRQQL